MDLDLNRLVGEDLWLTFTRKLSIKLEYNLFYTSESALGIYERVYHTPHPTIFWLCY